MPRQSAYPSIMSGQRFGLLVVIEFAGKNVRGAWLWLCRCDCGKQTIVMQSHLWNGHTQSCGHLQREKVTTHGMRHSPLHPIWAAIIQRTTNPNAQRYADWGGREVPITICRSWRYSFAAFVRDVAERPAPGLIFDRANNDGGYWCGHCEECVANGWPKNWRWATAADSANNTRANRRYTYNGETRTVAQWARHLGIHRNTLDARLARHSVEEAFTLPKHQGQKLKKKEKK